MRSGESCARGMRRDVGDTVGKAVSARDSPRDFNHAAVVESEHARSAGLTGHQTENTRAASEIEDDVALPDRRVNGLAEGVEARTVAQVFTMLVEL